METKTAPAPSIDKPWMKYYPAGADERAWRCSGTAYEQLRAYNRDRMDNAAIEYFGTRISFRDMFKTIDHLADVLTAYGIGDGDACMICLPNIPEIVYFIYALNRIGAVACLIDPRTNSEGILERAEDAKVKLMIVIGDVLETKIEPILDSLSAEKIVVCYATDSLKTINAQAVAIRMKYLFRQRHFEGRFISYQDFVRSEAAATSPPLPPKEGRPAIVVYTSGTTGTAKGVVLTNESIIGSINQLKDYVPTNSLLEEGQPHSFLGIIAFFTAYGACCGMNAHLSKGWTLVLFPIFKPADFGRLIVRYEVRSALGVPRFWESFAEAQKDTDLSFLQDPICGGDKISPASVEMINRYFHAHGAGRLKVGYGASEFAGAVVVTTDFGAYDTSSVGEPLPGVDAMVIDPDTGETLPFGEDGELCFRSPSMMSGYLNNPEETDAITVISRDGRKFYRTGDKGHISATGQVYIIDRYKRVMMRPDGHTVHASPIENVIVSHSAVRECAVVGLQPSHGAGVIPTAFVVLHERPTDTAAVIDEIDALCLRRIPERDKAHAYVLVDHLPYTLLGKVDYRTLEKESLLTLPYIAKDHTFLERRMGKNHD